MPRVYTLTYVIDDGSTEVIVTVSSRNFDAIVEHLRGELVTSRVPRSLTYTITWKGERA